MSKLDEIERVALPVVERHGCELVQVSFNREAQGRVLRLLVERKGSDPATGSGVDHALCASISRELSDAVEAWDSADAPLVLEVSSPGIERPLVRPADYERFAGRPVRMRTIRVVDGRKRFTGLLGGLDAGAVTVLLDDGGRAVIPLELITKANLVFDPGGVKVKAGEE